MASLTVFKRQHFRAEALCIRWLRSIPDTIRKYKIPQWSNNLGKRFRNHNITTNCHYTDSFLTRRLRLRMKQYKTDSRLCFDFAIINMIDRRRIKNESKDGLIILVYEASQNNIELCWRTKFVCFHKNCVEPINWLGYRTGFSEMQHFLCEIQRGNKGNLYYFICRGLRIGPCFKYNISKQQKYPKGRAKKKDFFLRIHSDGKNIRLGIYTTVYVISNIHFDRPTVKNTHVPSWKSRTHLPSNRRFFTKRRKKCRFWPMCNGGTCALDIERGSWIPRTRKYILSGRISDIYSNTSLLRRKMQYEIFCDVRVTVKRDVFFSSVPELKPIWACGMEKGYDPYAPIEINASDILHNWQYNAPKHFDVKAGKMVAHTKNHVYK